MLRQFIFRSLFPFVSDNFGYDAQKENVFVRVFTVWRLVRNQLQCIFGYFYQR